MVAEGTLIFNRDTGQHGIVIWVSSSGATGRVLYEDGDLDRVVHFAGPFADDFEMWGLREEG